MTKQATSFHFSLILKTKKIKKVYKSTVFEGWQSNVITIYVTFTK